jgi:hypothetical protein
MAESVPKKEPADAPWDKTNHFDFIYDVAKERGTKVEF